MQSATVCHRPLFVRQVSQIVFMYWLLGGQPVFAQTCVIDGPRYNLSADTVYWSMQAASDLSCIRGLRFANVEIESVKLVSPPQSGEVQLHGAGFTYTPKANFNGQDSFSLAVIGAIKKTHGSSTIIVTISVGQSATRDTRDTIPPIVSATQDTPDTIRPIVIVTAPPQGAIVSGSQVTLTASASDNVAVARVQFIVDGEQIGPVITSPPYMTTWDSTGVADGSHTLSAVAQDTTGNNSITSSVLVTVKNIVAKPSTGR
jgi:hypothetical protein